MNTITVTNPGKAYKQYPTRWPLLINDIQTDNYRSSLRNKLVAEGFYLTGNIEKYGSGFIRIRKALRDYPKIDFEIKEFAGGVMATFTRREGVNGLRSYIQSHPGQRSSEMVDALNTPLRTIERWLKQLKENGSIEFRGAAKTGGYYYLDSDK